jgi:hypothetical protein
LAFNPTYSKEEWYGIAKDVEKGGKVLESSEALKGDIETGGFDDWITW